MEQTYEIKNIKVTDLEINKGQIFGLPKNPRLIRDERYNALKHSIEEAPEMLGLRELLVYPYEGKYIVIGGNMRLRACLDLGYAEIPCKVLPKETPVAKLREYVIKDNESFGQNDWDILANEWDSEELKDWGMELFDFDPNGVQENDSGTSAGGGDDGIDTNAIINAASSDAAIKKYSEDTNYDLTKLYRKRVNSDIVSAIEQGINNKEIRPEIADVLKARATQCNIFNFDEIIKYFRSDDATETEKNLLKRLYMVFVTPKDMFEAGILKIKELSKVIYDNELLNDNYEYDDEEAD